MPRRKKIDGQSEEKFTTLLRLGPALGAQIYGISERSGIPITNVIRILLQKSLGDLPPELDVTTIR
jgi:hypothetical protein